MNDDAITITHGSISKDEVVAVLNGLRVSFVYAFIIDHDVSQSELPAKIRGKQFGFVGKDDTIAGLELTGVADMLASPNHRRIIQENFRLMLRQTLVRNTHELVLLYCQETNQYPKYRAKGWFQFARIWRNILSHKDGSVLHRWPDDLKKAGVLSASWRGRTISASDLGKVVGLDPWEAFKLHDDIANFLRLELD